MAYSAMARPTPTSLVGTGDTKSCQQVPAILDSQNGNGMSRLGDKRRRRSGDTSASQQSDGNKSVSEAVTKRRRRHTEAENSEENSPESESAEREAPSSRGRVARGGGQLDDVDNEPTSSRRGRSDGQLANDRNRQFCTGTTRLTRSRAQANGGSMATSTKSASEIPLNHPVDARSTISPKFPLTSAKMASDAAASSSPTSSLDNVEPPVSLWGPDPIPLPQRFSKIKKSLIAGHEAEVEASWARIIAELRAEVENIETLGAQLIPSVEFADLNDTTQKTRFGHDLRRYGVGVIRNVVPREQVDSAVQDTVQYLEGRKRDFGSAQQQSDQDLDTGSSHQEPKPSRLPRFRAPKQDPTCFDCFWTPAQVRCRAHSNVLEAQRFMMGLWEAQADGRLETQCPITYVDRLRVHGGGFDDGISTSDAGTPKPSSTASSTPELNFTWPRSQPKPPELPQQQLQSQALAPQPADDWIVALQSSAGVIAQVDNGSLERWEPDGYGRSHTYDKVFHGQWEDYDPWECTGRASSTMDLYNGYGACTIFRMFQGLLALSTIEPGMLRLLPSPKLTTAYYLLRPFFSPKRQAPSRRSGPEWDAYLDPSNWELQKEPDTTIHGAVPGHAQRLTELWHPHLYLRSTLITLPTLQPGDYIFWHPDLPYHISSSSQQQSPGTPSRSDVEDVSMLVYIPAAPLTQTNALYLARQRKAFQRGQPGPDFDSSGRGTVAEDTTVMPGEKEIKELGGVSALRAMGLAPWSAADERLSTKSELQPDATDKRAPSKESEVIRIANLILFPE